MRYTKENLMEDMRVIAEKAKKEDYLFGAKDVFAIGYMCGKYGVERLLDNQEEVIEACRKYDETDDLKLLDTIGETLVDLGVIKNDGRI